MIEKNDPAFVEKVRVLGFDWKALVADAWAIVGPIIEQLGPAQPAAAVQWVIAYIEAWLKPAPVPPTPPTPSN